MNYKKEKLLNICFIATAITLFLYWVLGSVLFFSLFGGTRRSTEPADFALLLDDFQKQVQSCVETFLFSQQSENVSKNMSKDGMLHCSESVGKLFAVTLFYPFEVETYPEVSLMKSVAAALGSTLTFEESWICVEKPSTVCNTMLSVYGFFGLLINAILAFLASIFLSSRILSMILNLPYMDNRKQIVITCSCYVTVEILMVIVVSTVLFFSGIGDDVSDESSYFASVSRVLNYLAFVSGFDLNVATLSTFVALTDVFLKIASLINLYLLLTILMTITRIVNRQYTKHHVCATLGTNSIGACCSRPKRAADLYTLRSITSGAEETFNKEGGTNDLSNKSSASEYLLGGGSVEHHFSYENFPHTHRSDLDRSPDHKTAADQTDTPSHLRYPVPMEELEAIYADPDEYLANYYTPTLKPRLALHESSHGSLATYSVT